MKSGRDCQTYRKMINKKQNWADSPIHDKIREQESNSNTNTVSGYTVSEWSKSRKGIEGRIKSPIIWGHAKEKNCIFPLAYLRKPKYMNNDSWMKVVDSIRLNMPETFIKFDEPEQ